MTIDNDTAKRDGVFGERWIDAAKGSFVLAPAGMTHDFENRSAERAGVLNFSIPGDFEKNMPDIAKWFAGNPPKDAREYVTKNVAGGLLSCNR